MLAKFSRILDELCYDYDEILKRQNITQEEVDKLREMAKCSRFVPKIIFDKQLAVYVNGYHENTEASSKWLHMNYKIRSTTPEFFSNRRPNAPEIIDALEHQCFAVFPSTPDNYFVFYHSLLSHEPRKFNFDNAVKAYMMMGEAILSKEGPRLGAVLIFDLKGSKFGHLFRASIHSVRKGLEYLQCANPMRIKSIHVINSYWLMDFVFAIMKPFIKKEFLDLFHLHDVGSNLEKLYETVPTSHLPKELGGELGSVLEFHEKTRLLFEEMKDYFEIEEKNTKLELDHLVNSEEYKHRDKYQENIKFKTLLPLEVKKLTECELKIFEKTKKNFKF